MARLREFGIRVAVMRPISLWPFPGSAVRAAADDADTIVVAELSMGQMIHDVAEVIGRRPDHLVNWLGGRAPSTDEFATRVADACGLLVAAETGGAR